MTSKQFLPRKFRPIQVETINMIFELFDDEEDEF